MHVHCHHPAHPEGKKQQRYPALTRPPPVEVRWTGRQSCSCDCRDGRPSLESWESCIPPVREKRGREGGREPRGERKEREEGCGGREEVGGREWMWEGRGGGKEEGGRRKGGRRWSGGLTELKCLWSLLSFSWHLLSPDMEVVSADMQARLDLERDTCSHTLSLSPTGSDASELSGTIYIGGEMQVMHQAGKRSWQGYRKFAATLL